MRFRLACLGLLFCSTTALAQTAAPADPKQPPPPLWDAQVGASFVGTTGNTDTSSLGFDFGAHRRGEIWQIDSTATAIRTSDNGIQTAERVIGAARVNRSLSDILGVSAGERAEHDPMSGIDFRSISDASLSWKLLRMPRWTVDGITGFMWDHETRTLGPNLDDPGAILQVLSRIPFGAAGDTTQRYALYPDFRTPSAFRQEAEFTAQAAMAAHLALKLGYLIRYSNDPVPGFKRTDNTATASVVLRWKSDAPAAR